MYFNAQKSAQELAQEFKTSLRTIQRWLYQARKGQSSVDHKGKGDPRLKRQCPENIQTRILELKTQNPARSAPMLQQLLKKENTQTLPSISTIRKLVAREGLSKRESSNRQGYIKFERKQPNDLWQVDLAGRQTLGHMGNGYLIALLDDCSRFVVAAYYFPDEKGTNILQLLKEAFTASGRPNQILADNGAQFHALMAQVETKYTHLLKTLGVEPIFARPHHPQTKGKLERWFGVVIQMFLVEERIKIKENPAMTMDDVNKDFAIWLHYYNYEKPHRSLHGKSPDQIYLETEPRVYRPLETLVNWDLWINTTSRRKVTKYNQVKYEDLSEFNLFTIFPDRIQNKFNDGSLSKFEFRRILSFQ